MSESLRPVVNIEDGVGESQAEVGRQEEAGAGRAVQRRRVGEAGDAALDEAQLLRLNMEAQAQAIEGMERARLLGEELQRARAREAELSAVLKIHVDAIRSKDALLLAKDTIIQSKDREIGLLLQGQAKDSEPRLLQVPVESKLQSAAAASPHAPVVNSCSVIKTDCHCRLPHGSLRRYAAANKHVVSAFLVSTLPLPPSVLPAPPPPPPPPSLPRSVTRASSTSALTLTTSTLSLLKMALRPLTLTPSLK
jgi:hypothetical protein